MIKLLSTWRTWFEGQPQSEPAIEEKMNRGKREKRKKGKWEIRKHYKRYLRHTVAQHSIA